MHTILDEFIAIAVIAICIVLLKRYFPWFAGRMGESKVGAELKRLDPSQYTVLNDVLIASSRPGATSQIDHVVLSRFGIFVVETKNREGWIFGGERDRTWTAKFRRASHQFQNPIRQNRGHILALAAILRLPNECFRSIIAFGPEATFKLEVTTPVVYYRDLAPTIASFGQPILEPAQVVEAIAILRDKNIVAPGARQAHVNQIRQRDHGRSRR